LKLSAADFFIPATEPKRNPDADRFDNPPIPEVRPWVYITQNQYCSLFRLIQLTVEASCCEWQALETPSQRKIVSTLLTSSHNKGPYIQILEVVADYD
jgi:hypothetical protein